MKIPIRFIQIFFTTLFTISNFQFIQAESCEKHYHQPCYLMTPFPAVEAGYSFGQFIGINQNYADVGLFTPILTRNKLTPFIDCRLYRFDSSKWGVSTGIGCRNSLFNKSVVGANIFYDYLDGKFDTNFNRLGIGVEWFYRCFNLTLNTYLPLGKRESVSKTVIFDDYIGNYRASCLEKEYSIDKGFDAEIGCQKICLNTLTLYGGLGPYYYCSKNHTNYFGGLLKLEAYYSSYISLQLKSSYDSVNGSQLQGRVQLTIPLNIFWGGRGCDDRGIRLGPVKRTGTIFTEKCCHYDWNW